MTSVDFTIYDPYGKEVASAGVKTGMRIRSERGLPAVMTALQVPSVRTWSAETPWLYTLKVTAYNKKGATETTSIKFGFRDIAIENGQLLVNGQPVLIKGVNRHELNPYKGYVVS